MKFINYFKSPKLAADSSAEACMATERILKNRTRGESACKAVRDNNKRGESAYKAVRDNKKQDGTPVRKLQKRSAERGNVLFIILIATALFGALSYAVSDMMRTGKAEHIPQEQAKVYAAQIIDYGNVARQAVQNMLINGCDKSEISFSQTSGDAYEHSPVSATKCKLFETRGGAVKAEPPSEGINDGSFYVFTGAHAAENIGSACATAACADLLMVLENIDKAVCLSINDRLDIDNPGGDAPNDAGGALTPFTGTFAYGNVLLDEDTALDGQSAGCYRDTPANTYSYFRVLIAR